MEMSGLFHENRVMSGDVWVMSRSCLDNVMVMFRSFLDHVLVISVSCLGHKRVMLMLH